jgi:hypothetical protein
MPHSVNNQTEDVTWRRLYRIAGVAALIVVLVFRRNFGTELTAFGGFGLFDVPETAPVTAQAWFALFQSRAFLGLVLFELFDIVNYALVGLIFLALYGALKNVNQGVMALATACALMGVGLYLGANQAFAMLTLSQQHAAATTEAQQNLFLAAGEALLAIHNAGNLYQGTSIHLGLCLVLLAGLLVSIVMLRSQVFNRATAITGLLANGLGLAYFPALAFAPVIVWLPPTLSAPFRIAWYVLIALKLLRLSKTRSKS